MESKLEEILLAIERQTKETKEVRRIQADILSVVNKTYKDREIISDTHDSILGVKEKLINDRKHNDTLLEAVEAKIGDVGAKFDENTVTIKAPTQSVVDKIFSMLKKKK